MSENYLKLYICILDEAPDYMVPTLVAHTVINAHNHFRQYSFFVDDQDSYFTYKQWKDDSYRKVTLRVNRKEYDKIKASLIHYEGYEKTICNGQGSCLIPLPVWSDKVPNVLKYGKLWKPKETK